MWYEITPVVAILLAGISAPPIFAYFAQKLVQNGNPYRRDIRKDPFDKGLLQRDIFLFKKPYKIQGLDNIPDEKDPEDPSSEGKKKISSIC